MINFVVTIIKVIFLLGFLIFIHEGGHYIVAKLCKVTVNEFSIGFGYVIWKKRIKETEYKLRLIPLGGFVSLEGENESSEKEGSYSKASIPKRMAIIVAGGLVNIFFAILLYYCLMLSINNHTQFGVIPNTVLNNLYYSFIETRDFIVSIFENLKMLLTGNVSINQFMGPVGISGVVAQTSNIKEFVYILSLVSFSLGITNLLPFPALDGGKFLLLIIEAIRGKKMNEKLEINIQLLGFAILITLSIYITYHDIVRLL